MKIFYIKYFLLLAALVFSSCSSWVSPQRILKVNKDTELTDIEYFLREKEHVISVNDEISLLVLPNNAEILLNPEFSQGAQQTNEIKLIVLNDGYVNLPGIGKQKIAGLKISEAETFLSNKFKILLNEPYVKITVTNKRVMVYTDINSGGSVVHLIDNSANLIEALTLSGGIISGKSKEIYLFRKDETGDKITKIDLSESNKIKYSQIVMQSNDIIIVNSRPYVAKRTLEEVGPYLSLVTTLLLIINIFK